MIDIIEFPVTAVPIIDPSVAIVYNTRPPQEATNGMQRSRGMSGARWKMQFTVAVNTEQQARTMRGFFFNMEADSQLVRIRMPDVYGIDGPFAAATRENRMAYPFGIPFATDVMFSTGVGYAIPTLDTYFDRAAALNDREIYVRSEDEIPGGCAISIDEFCYGVAGSWIEDGQQRLKISPVLRKHAATSAVISLAPVFVGTCITQNPGYDALSHGRFGSHTLEFVEDLTRLVGDVD